MNSWGSGCACCCECFDSVPFTGASPVELLSPKRDQSARIGSVIEGASSEHGVASATWLCTVETLSWFMVDICLQLLLVVQCPTHELQIFAKGTASHVLFTALVSFVPVELENLNAGLEETLIEYAQELCPPSTSTETRCALKR